MHHWKHLSFLSSFALRAVFVKGSKIAVFVSIVTSKRAWWPPLFITFLSSSWLVTSVYQASSTIYVRFLLLGNHLKIGIPKGMVFGPFGSENGFTLCPFWSGIGSEIGSGFGEPGGIPPPRNTRSTLCEDRHGAASLRENSLRNYPPYGWSKALVSWFLAGERAI